MSGINKICMAPIDENNYAKVMQDKVEPYLASLRTDGYFAAADGKKIHYEYYLLPEARASLVISHGFTESAEKFREMSFYFLQAGYNVFAIDHRGHGLSHRVPKDTALSHIDSFNEYIKDFCCFINKVVKPVSKGLPLYLYGHSMGGAVAILYLQRHPHVFDKAVLTAPMVIPNTGFPLWFSKAIIGLFTLIGKGNERVFFKNGFNPNATYENSNDTSKARFDYYQSKRCSDRFLQNSAPSYKWVWESLDIIKGMLSQKNCDKICADVLLIQAETDGSVLLDPQVEFISKVNHGELVKMYGSKHEIYLSTNDVMEKYLDKIFDFLG